MAHYRMNTLLSITKYEQCFSVKAEVSHSESNFTWI